MAYTLRGSRRFHRGLTLVELMVALAIGLLLVVAMSALFVGSSSSRREVEISAEVIESGRYGIELLNRDLSQAGFYGPLVVPPGNTVNLCSTDLAVWSDSLAVHAVGLNNAEADPACIVRKAGTDAIFIQRASTCAVGEAGCEAENANNGYIQVSECGAEYSTTPFVVAKGNEPATVFKLSTKACGAAKAEKRKLIRRLYYVNADEMLVYRDVTRVGVTDEVVLVDNIDQMQLEYAFDTDSDGTADCFGSTLADCGAAWPNAIGVRVWLLARSTTASKNTKNAVSFEMADTVHDVAAATSNFKRRVYSTHIPFVTPKSRRES